MSTPIEIVKALELSAMPEDLSSVAKRLLLSHDFSTLTEQGFCTAEEGVRLLRLRNESIARTGRSIGGIDYTIRKLEEMPQESRLKLTHLSSEKHLISIYFMELAPPIPIAMTITERKRRSPR